MAFNADISKAVVRFYRIDSETAFERHRGRIPINEVNTVLAAGKAPHFVPWSKEFLSSKYGLGHFYVKLYHKAPKLGGNSDSFA